MNSVIKPYVHVCILHLSENQKPTCSNVAEFVFLYKKETKHLICLCLHVQNFKGKIEEMTFH